VFKIIGVEKLLMGLEKVAFTPSRTHELMVKTGYVIQGQARVNLDLPHGGFQTTNTGRLSQSIVVEDRPFDKAVVVGTNVQYAPFVEFGTRPHMPPVEPLKEWAALKLHNPNAGYAVAKKIARQGTKPKPFMRPAIRVGQKYFERNAKKVWGK